VINKYNDKAIKVKKFYSEKDLDQLATVKKHGSWRGVPESVRLPLLWELGLNVKGYGYHEQLCKHRTQNGGTLEVVGLQIYSQERTDKEWLDKRVEGVRVASLEAQLLAKGDKSLRQELRKLGATGI
jgi:hypothetical protein